MRRLLLAALVFVWFDPVGFLDRVAIFEMKMLKMQVEINQKGEF